MAAAEQPDAEPRTAPTGRRRIATAIIVPVVGIALSAWLLPAITRQWDDRQKEREMKAAIVDDIASATARALVAGDAIWTAASQPSNPRLRDRRLSGQRLVRVGDGWTLASLKIEARLRTYFPADVVAGWQVYTWAVDRFIRARRVSAAAALRDVVTQRVRLSSQVANAAALLLAYGAHAMPPRPNFTGDSLVEETEVNHLTSMLPTARYESEVAKGPRYTWRVLEKLVLKFQQAVDDRILTAHAAGYSTTAGDLITDLVP